MKVGGGNEGGWGENEGGQVGMKVGGVCVCV